MADEPPSHAPQGIRATQSPRGPVSRACQPISGGLHGAEPTFGPALHPSTDNRPSVLPWRATRCRHRTEQLYMRTKRGTARQKNPLRVSDTEGVGMILINCGCRYDSGCQWTYWDYRHWWGQAGSSRCRCTQSRIRRRCTRPHSSDLFRHPGQPCPACRSWA